MAAARSIVFVIWMYGLMAAMGLALAPILLAPRGASAWALRTWLALTFWGLRVFCGITWEARGLERLPEGGALVASKHQSMFETLAFWAILKDPAIILKRALAMLPVFGWYAVKLGNIVVDRSQGAAALRKMVRDAKDRADAGRQVVIFPEGTRVRPGETEPFKPGVAALYKEMGAPIAPVALNSGLYWPARGLVRRPGHIVIEFLDPIPPGLARKDVMARLRTAIDHGSAALAGAATARTEGPTR